MTDLPRVVVNHLYADAEPYEPIYYTATLADKQRNIISPGDDFIACDAQKRIPDLFVTLFKIEHRSGDPITYVFHGAWPIRDLTDQSDLDDQAD